MADKNKKLKSEKKEELKYENESFSHPINEVERTLEELLFVNVDYKDINKLKKLRKLNNQQYINIIKKLKDIMKEAI